MPNPRVAAILGAEVGLAVVVDLGGEAEKATVARGGVGVGGGGRETVLLHGTLQQEHGPVLQVGSLLHNLSVKHQVRCSYGRQTWVTDGKPLPWAPLRKVPSFCTRPSEAGLGLLHVTFQSLPIILSLF